MPRSSAPGHWPIQRPALPARKTIAVDQHDVDVRRTVGDRFGQQQRSLVHHRQQRTYLNLVDGQAAECNAFFGTCVVDQAMNCRVGSPAPALVVEVIARAGLAPDYALVTNAERACDDAVSAFEKWITSMVDLDPLASRAEPGS